MQRKNSILKHNAMAMIMAIATIVIIGSIMALTMAMTAQTTKRTTDMYLYEQSMLLSKSAVEYALLKIADDGPCSHSTSDILDFQQDSIYNINIDIKYIYDDATNPCTTLQTYTTVNTPEQNGSVLIDIAVSVDDDTISTEPIRYFRRTIQKL